MAIFNSFLLVYPREIWSSTRIEGRALSFSKALNWQELCRVCATFTTEIDEFLNFCGLSPMLNSELPTLRCEKVEIDQLSSLSQHFSEFPSQYQCAIHVTSHLKSHEVPSFRWWSTSPHFSLRKKTGVGIDVPKFGDFEHHLEMSVGDYIPNRWVMF